MHVAHGVKESRHLLLAGAHDSGIRVAGRSDAERGGQIEILATRFIPDVNAFGARPDDWPGGVRLHERDVARLVLAQEVEGVHRWLAG